MLETIDTEFMRKLLKKVFGNTLKMLTNGFKIPMFVFLPKSLLQTHAG